MPLAGPALPHIHPQDDGRACIARRAAGEEAVAASKQGQFLDQLDDQAHPCWSLGMTEDERAAVVIEAFRRHTHLAGKVDIVDGERVMRLDRFDLGQIDTRGLERIPCGWNRCLRHEAFLRTRLTESQDLDFDATVTAEFPGALTRGHNHPAASIGGMRLRPIADRAPLPHWSQSCQPLRRGGIDALIVQHGCYAFMTRKISDLQRCYHIPAMKGGILLECILVLVIAQQGERVLFFPGDARFCCDMFGGLDHRILGVGIAVEVVPYPILALASSAGGERVGVIDMRPVAGLIAGQRQDTALGIGLDLEGSARQHPR